MSAHTHCPTCGHALTPRQQPLTKPQAAVLDAIRSSVEQFGYAPTLGELATQFGYTSHSTVHEHLKNLERKGWIIRRFNAERGITLVDPDAPVALDALRTAGDAEVRE